MDTPSTEKDNGVPPSPERPTPADLAKFTEFMTQGDVDGKTPESFLRALVATALTSTTCVGCDECKVVVGEAQPYYHCESCKGNSNEHHNGFDLCVPCKALVDERQPKELMNGYHDHTTHSMILVSHPEERPAEHKNALPAVPSFLPVQRIPGPVAVLMKQLQAEAVEAFKSQPVALSALCSTLIHKEEDRVAGELVAEVSLKEEPAAKRQKTAPEE